MEIDELIHFLFFLSQLFPSLPSQVIGDGNK